MKKVHLFLSALLAGMVLAGCAVMDEEGDIRENSLVPGECLSSGSLAFLGAKDNASGNICLNFALDCAVQYEALSSRGGNVSCYRYAPAKEVYAAFGADANDVRKEYERAYEDIFGTFAADRCDFTIYYDGGITLTADARYAGHPAGEDLLPELAPAAFLPYGERTIPSEGFEYDFRLHRAVSILIPKSKAAVDVTFTLALPVKVGLYLTWLGNRCTDPDAPYPYREETLTCTFTVPAEALGSAQ